jgi:hypothetical protein
MEIAKSIDGAGVGLGLGVAALAAAAIHTTRREILRRVRMSDYFEIGGKSQAEIL